MDPVPQFITVEDAWDNLLSVLVLFMKDRVATDHWFVGTSDKSFKIKVAEAAKISKFWVRWIDNDTMLTTFHFSRLEDGTIWWESNEKSEQGTDRTVLSLSTIAYKLAFELEDWESVKEFLCNAKNASRG